MVYKCCAQNLLPALLKATACNLPIQPHTYCTHVPAKLPSCPSPELIAGTAKKTWGIVMQIQYSTTLLHIHHRFMLSRQHHNLHMGARLTHPTPLAQLSTCAAALASCAGRQCRNFKFVAAFIYSPAANHYPYPDPKARQHRAFSAAAHIYTTLLALPWRVHGSVTEAGAAALR